MISGLTITIAAVAFVLAGWSLVLLILNHPLGNALFYGLVVGELVVLGNVVVIIVALVGGNRPEAMATFVSYLALLPLVIPLATLWGLIERTRWGSGVIAVACLILPVLVLRLEQIWISVDA